MAELWNEFPAVFPWQDLLDCETNDDCRQTAFEFNENTAIGTCESTGAFGNVCMCNKFRLGQGNFCDEFSDVSIFFIVITIVICIFDTILLIYILYAFSVYYWPNRLQNKQFRGTQLSRQWAKITNTFNAGTITILLTIIILILQIVSTSFEVWSIQNPRAPLIEEIAGFLLLSLSISLITLAIVVISVAWNKPISQLTSSTLSTSRRYLEYAILVGALLVFIADIFFVVYDQTLLLEAINIVALVIIIAYYNYVSRHLIGCLTDDDSSSTSRTIRRVVRQNRYILFGMILLILSLASTFLLTPIGEPVQSFGPNLVLVFLHTVFLFLSYWIAVPTIMTKRQPSSSKSRSILSRIFGNQRKSQSSKTNNFTNSKQRIAAVAPSPNIVKAPPEKAEEG